MIIITKKDRFLENFFKKYGHVTPLLYAIHCIKYKSSEPVSTGNVYRAYRLICKELDTEPLTKGDISRIISRLVKFTTLNEKVVSMEQSGRTKLISFDLTKGMIKEIGDSMDEFIPKDELENLANNIRKSLK